MRHWARRTDHGAGWRLRLERRHYRAMPIYQTGRPFGKRYARPGWTGRKVWRWEYPGWRGYRWRP